MIQPLVLQVMQSTVKPLTTAQLSTQPNNSSQIIKQPSVHNTKRKIKENCDVTPE